MTPWWESITTGVSHCPTTGRGAIVFEEPQLAEAAYWQTGDLAAAQYTMPGHPVAAGHSALSALLRQRAVHEGIDCQQRKKVRCFILVRHPVERFLSYYQERTAAAPEP
eukprot:Skav202303  [mRNA]  locus=scaffold60:67148:72906:+ [translate_table: standard]